MSPSKKMKLSSQTRKTRSQDTKVTSTPQRAVYSDDQTVSPNVSRISTPSSVTVEFQRIVQLYEEEYESNKENRPKKITSEMRMLTISRPSSISSIFEHSNSESDVMSSVIVQKIKKVGTIWELYKPINKESLYALILDDPTQSQEIADELVKLYKRSPKSVIYRLLQFCLDVCGFQHVDVSKHYTFNDDSPKKLVNALERNDIVTPLHISGRYLFMETRGELTKSLKRLIYNFIQNVISQAYEQGILLEEFFIRNFFSFVKCLSFSIAKPTRHTGVVLAAKILTALVNIYGKVIIEMNFDSNCSNFTDDTRFQMLQQEKSALDNLLEIFYFIFIKNCRVQDDKLALMKSECIQEFQLWVKKIPKMLITELQAIDNLMKLIIDESKEVRYAAICACEELIDKANVMEYLKPFMNNLMEVVRQRFYDSDLRVAVKAIDLFSFILTIDCSVLPASRVKTLTNLIFDKYFRISEAACRFLKNYMTVLEDDSNTVIINFAKIILVVPFQCKKQLLVEGSLYVFPEMQDWNLFTTILLDKQLIPDILIAIACIFREAVYQTLSGQSSVLREDSRKVSNIDLSEHVKVVKCLPELNSILQAYSDCPEVLIEILNIFPCVNNEVITGNFCQEYMNLCEAIVEMFSHQSDEKLLRTSIEILEHLQTVPNIAERVKKSTEKLCAKFSKLMSDCLQVPGSDASGVVLKTSILYQYYSFNSKLQWEYLFDTWGETDENTTGNLIICCKWYLVWALRKVADTTVRFVQQKFVDQSTLLLRYCNEFTSTCFNMLHNLIGQDLHFKVYHCICDFHLMYNKELETSIKFNKQFEILQLKIKEVQLQDALKHFLEKYVISNKIMSLEDRRDNINKYVELVHNNILPIQGLACIFQYYYCYHDEYSRIIEQSLNDMIDSNDSDSILLMVVYTLTYVYEKILEKRNAIDIRTDEAKQLKLLAKQFAAFKYFRIPRKEFTRLIVFSINYSMKDDTKYDFLYFVKYFLDVVVNDGKTYIINFLKKNGPQGPKQPDSLKHFISCLKPNQSASLGNKSQKQPLKKTVSKTQPKKSVKENIKPSEKPKKKKNTKAAASKVSHTLVTPTAATQKSKKRQLDTETEMDTSISIHDESSNDIDDEFLICDTD